MQRYKLTVEYDGTLYCGWQRQDDVRSVQQSIEEAVFKFCQEQVNLPCAGRTDAGVHARGQVAQLDLAAPRSAYQVSEGINFYMQKEPIVILKAEEVSMDFHVRFSATARHYTYRIINRHTPLSIDLSRAWHVPQPLDIAAMQEAATHFIGHHDFTSFRATACQSDSPVKTLDLLEVKQSGHEILVHAKSRSFLHHQVRNMVGALVWVGRGKWTSADIDAALAARDRRAGAETAPACGLYFMGVTY